MTRLFSAVPHGVTLDDYVIWRPTTGRYSIKEGWEGRPVHSETGLVAAIQWAHDQLTGGGSIGLKMANYYTNSEWETKLTLSNHGVTLHGASLRAGTVTPTCWIRLANGVNDDMILITGVKCKVADLALDGNDTNQTAGSGVYDAAGPTSDFHLEDVYVIRCKDHGIEWAGGAGTAVNVYSEYNSGMGFQVSGDRNVFHQCGAYANVRTGWEITSQRNRLMACISASNSGTYGDGVQMSAATCQYTDLIGFVTHENNRYGILINGARRNQIIGGSDVLNGSHGIYFIVNAGVNTIHNKILGREVRDNVGTGILAGDANQDDNIITECVVLGNAAQINANGSTWTTDNNIVV